MSAVAIVSLVAVGVLVAAVAALALLVIGALGGVLSSLLTIQSAVRVIADRAGPIDPALAGVEDDLRAVAERFDQVVGTTTSKQMTVGNA